MTRKDFVALAEAIRMAHADVYSKTLTPGGAVWVVADHVADVLAARYPRFDRERFLDAC